MIYERYEIHVSPLEDCLSVSARLYERTKHSDRPMPSLMGYPDLTEHVYEPGWLARLLGDTIEARVQRAKRKVARAAERRIARNRHMQSLARSAARRVVA